jgi:hypothetical protein
MSDSHLPSASDFGRFSQLKCTQKYGFLTKKNYAPMDYLRAMPQTDGRTNYRNIGQITIDISRSIFKNFIIQ